LTAVYHILVLNDETGRFMKSSTWLLVHHRASHTVIELDTPTTSNSLLASTSLNLRRTTEGRERRGVRLVGVQQRVQPRPRRLEVGSGG